MASWGSSQHDLSGSLPQRTPARGDLYERCRVYLDAAILIDLYDGAIPPNEVERLRSALVEGHALVVVSLGHLIDLHRSDPPTAPAVFGRLFGLGVDVAMAVSPAAQEHADLLAALAARPGMVEASPPKDLLLQIVGSLSELESQIDDETRTWIRTIAALAPQAATAHEASRAARVQGDGTKLPRHVFETLFIQLMRSQGHDVIAGVPEAARESAMKVLELIRNIPRDLLPDYGAHGGNVEILARRLSGDPNAAGIDFSYLATKGHPDRWQKIAPAVAPGLFLSQLVQLMRQKDSTRKNKPSDLADLEHLKVIPYVDIATTDGENVGVIGPRINELRGSRGVSILPNGERSRLVEAIRGCRRTS